MTHRLLTAALLGTLLVTAASAAGRRAGTLDPLFGTAGISRLSLQSYFSVSRIARQPDGRLVIAGEFSGQGGSALGLARVLPNGALDPGFGGSGVVRDEFNDLAGGGWSASVGSVQIDGQGRILVAGSVSQPNASQLMLTRFLSDGTPDPSFGLHGRVLGTSGTHSELRQTALLSNGTITATGSSTLGGDRSVLLVRYRANGTPDPNFGVGGRVVTPLGNSSRATSLALRPNGKIVVGGTIGSDLGVIQYLPEGGLDPTFGNSGVTRVDLRQGQEELHQIALQRDGRLIAGGESYALEGSAFMERPMLVRLTSRGKLDRSFGTRGIARGKAGAQLLDLALEKNGRIVAAGPDAGQFTLSRFTTAGKPDRLFGTNGIVALAMPTAAQCQALLFDPDGKIVAAGRAEVEGGLTTDLLLARLLTR